MKRIRHYLSRLKSLDVRNMFVVAASVATESGKPRAIILVDMALCSVIYQAGYLDYQEFEFWSLNRRERRTWITSGNANSIVVKYNQRAFREKFFDKPTFNALFNEYLGREWLDVRTTSAVELQQFVTAHDMVMVKRVDGMSGAGIQKYRHADITSYELFRAELLAHEQYLVEAFIVQHPKMASLSPASVNSLRLITFFDGTTVHVMEAVLRMGNGADVDNYGRGGMYTVLDEKTGIAGFGAFDKFANTFDEHPLTGTPIVGFQVPLYDEVLQLLDTISRIVPEIPYVGWDVAIGEHGPVIIEGNYNTGVFQMKPSLTGNKIGLLPRFREVIDF
ncbi:sugar-transfer associated ATP-grasp domain-containing protein [Salinibacterium sp. G-O1]|uniref:sugar-transfer associated ATP-grasp domain-containing protein n=1 Tax=Salinibacterium sp. G-O1 TaxID=3046208 RepID=UPI0024B98FE7|nr:sugar-transfer associated ATP-grasp domain-containing protein [Salinibacterium sp. G-O1]MDJ0335262.1 sugar-transfer associated ATP-grasp domain-containing protein [Salinibacterium sp. G-O1]